MVAAAVIGAGVIGAAATAYAGHEASQAQQNAANQGNAELQREYDLSRSDQAPYRQAGYAALGRLSDLLGTSGNIKADGYGSLTQPISVGDVTSEPGYQFGLNQGLRTEQNSAAARGGLYSGATLKALTQYGNDYATTKYDDAWQRLKSEQDTLFNRLSGVAGTGQTATQAVDNLGQQTANQISQNTIGAGNARGASYIATGNAVANGANSLGGAWWLNGSNGAGADFNGNPWSGYTYKDPGSVGPPAAAAGY